MAAQAAEQNVIVIHTDNLAEESRRLLAQYQDESAQHSAVYHELFAQLTIEQRKLLIRVSDAQTATHCTWNELIHAELARHVPGLYGTLRMLWIHIGVGYEDVGVCCTVAEGFEP